MNRNRNHNYNRQHRSEYFNTPPPSDTYDYDSDDQRQFDKLLRMYPWNEHRWFGIQDSDDDDRCERVNTNIKIANPITDKPDEIYPYQAAFASYYGYLPKGYSIPKRSSKRKKNRSKIPKLCTEQRLKARKRKRHKNIEIYEENKRRKRAKRNLNTNTKQRKQNTTNNNNKVEVSHICGKNNCITINHLELANRKKNNERAKCHAKIDKMENKRRQPQYRNRRTKSRRYKNKKPKVFHVELESDDECDHEPHCFRNYHVTEWISYYIEEEEENNTW